MHQSLSILFQFTWVSHIVHILGLVNFLMVKIKGLTEKPQNERRIKILCKKKIENRIQYRWTDFILFVVNEHNFFFSTINILYVPSSRVHTTI